MAERSEKQLRELEEMGQEIARMMGTIINRAMMGYELKDRTAALDKPLFTLLLFTPGENGWVTYTSSAERADMIKSIEELLPTLKAGKERLPLRDMN